MLHERTEEPLVAKPESRRTAGTARYSSAMQTPATKDFQVAIVGGGVSGLVCAIALQRAGVSVDIFEAAVSLASSLAVAAVCR